MHEPMFFVTRIHGVRGAAIAPTLAWILFLHMLGAESGILAAATVCRQQNPATSSGCRSHVHLAGTYARVRSRSRAHSMTSYSLRFNAQQQNREVGNTHAERAKPLTSQQKSRRCLFPEGAEGSKEFVKTCECTYVAGPHMQSRPKVRPWGLAHCLKN